MATKTKKELETELTSTKTELGSAQEEINQLNIVVEHQSESLKSARKDLDRENEELEHKTETISDLKSRLDNSLDRGTAEFFMNEISDIVQAICNQLS